MRSKGKEVYAGVLNIPAGESGSTRVRHAVVPAGEPLRLGTARTALIGGQRGGKVSWPYETRWHVLEYEGGVWMSDYPIEQRQCDSALARVRAGRVLVGGLGLGYALTVLANERPRVAHVTCIEQSRDVCNLVWPHLSAAVHDRTTVVTADLFSFLGELIAGNPRTPTFDWAFYDIWQSDGEGTFFQVVVPLLALSARIVRHDPICWNEDVMRGQLYYSLTGRLLCALDSRVRDLMDIKFTLDDLCEDANAYDIWRHWSVPFFRYIRRLERGDARSHLTHDQLAGLFAGLVGRPNGPVRWTAVTGGDADALTEATAHWRRLWEWSLSSIDAVGADARERALAWIA